MKCIEDMSFSTKKTRDGRWIGIVAEFPSLQTPPMADKLEAVSRIVSMTSERIRDIRFINDV